MDLEVTSIRIVLLLLMLGFASIFDIRTRRIPDLIWVVCGGMGSVLYFFDWQSIISYHALSMITTGAVALLLYLYRLTGTADVFAMLSMAVILPVHYEFVMVPIVVLIGGFVITGFVTLVQYVILKSKRKILRQVKPQPFLAYMFGFAVFFLLPEIFSLVSV